MELPKEQPNQLNIEISKEVSEGVYANIANQFFSYYNNVIHR
jgi:hypothetical protein